MNRDHRTVGALLIFTVFAGFVMTSQALGDEVAVAPAVQASSSSARVAISATILERPNFSCDQILRSVSVEIAAGQLRPDDNLHPVATLRVNCADLRSMFGVTTGIAPTEPATSRRASTAPVLVVPAGRNLTARTGGAGSSGHRHEVGVIFNFE